MEKQQLTSAKAQKFFKPETGCVGKLAQGNRGPEKGKGRHNVPSWH